MASRLLLGIDLSFSPVAGIQWVETAYRSWWGVVGYKRFSPVAGIQWVETLALMLKRQTLKSLKFQSRCRDSVG